MAKLLPAVKTVFEPNSNAYCNHCSCWLSETDSIPNNQDYVFWCSNCCKDYFHPLKAALISVEPKFKFLPITFDVCGKPKAYQYHWWCSGEYVKAIRTIPKPKPIRPNKIVIIQ